ncbi:MAG: DUF3426 domain-containing protein [Rhodospirillales bacterium]
MPPLHAGRSAEPVPAAPPIAEPPAEFPAEPTAEPAADRIEAATDPPFGDENREPIPAVLTATRSDVRKPPPARRRAVSGGAIAALAVGGALLLAAVLMFARESIVAALPAAAGVYAALGLGADAVGEGLDIRDVRSDRQSAVDGEALVVAGVVANIADGPRELPLIRVALFDADDEELQSITVSPDRPALPPGETLAFTARLDNPMATARRIKVTFAPRNGDS